MENKTIRTLSKNDLDSVVKIRFNFFFQIDRLLVWVGKRRIVITNRNCWVRMIPLRSDFFKPENWQVFVLPGLFSPASDSRY
jgi:hypothetical protein